MVIGTMWCHLVLVLAPLAVAIDNVVILYANNIRADDLSCYNPSASVKTPNIDRLAAEGVLLGHHTVPALTLTANRAAHLTGQLPQRYGLQESGQGVRHILHTLSDAGLPDKVQTYADIFKKAGYKTKATGSWELGWSCRSWQDACHSPLRHGFDSFYGVPLSVRPPSLPAELPTRLLARQRDLAAFLTTMANQTRYRDIYRPISETGWYEWLALAAQTTGGSWQLPYQLTPQLQQLLDLLVVEDDAVRSWPYTLQGITLPILDEALQFVKDSARAKKPFLLQHTFMHVHEPSITAPHRVGASGSSSYYDSVLELDWAVGRVLEQLDTLGLLKTTLIYFSADYSDQMSPPGTNKTDTRVPGIFMWKGLITPFETKRLTSVLDIFPTVVDAIGQGKELARLQLDGRSLFFSLLTQSESDVSEQFNFRGENTSSLTLVHPSDSEAIYKLYMDPECQLCQGFTTIYNLTADPNQQDPLSEDTAIFTQISERVRERLFFVESTPSQLDQFWKVAPLPALFPWTQVALFEPSVDSNSAGDYYAFLQAEVVYASESKGPGSGGGSGAGRNIALDPAATLYFRSQREDELLL